MIHVVRDAVAKLGEVVRRDVGGHAHGDAGGAVQQQVRELRGEDGGFARGLVVVGHHIDGVLLQVAEQLLGDLLHAHLGVTHGGGAVAVDGAEVSVAIDQRAAEREVLRHAHDRLVHGRVAVRVVLADHVADDACALEMLGVPGVVEHVHRVEAPAVDGLESVPHVGKGAPHDHRHRVVDVVARHLVFDVDVFKRSRHFRRLFRSCRSVLFFCHLGTRLLGVQK